MVVGLHSQDIGSRRPVVARLGYIVRRIRHRNPHLRGFDGEGSLYFHHGSTSQTTLPSILAHPE